MTGLFREIFKGNSKVAISHMIAFLGKHPRLSGYLSVVVISILTLLVGLL